MILVASERRSKGYINNKKLTVSKGKLSCDKSVCFCEYEVTSNNNESNNDRRSERYFNKNNTSKSKGNKYFLQKSVSSCEPKVRNINKNNFSKGN